MKTARNVSLLSYLFGLRQIGARHSVAQNERGDMPPIPLIKSAFPRRALALVLLAFIGVFFVTIWFRAISTGICCADDSAMAAVAKNVAAGAGYSLPLTPRGLSPFDPGISTGAPLILPTAALISLFGADPRLPGMATTAVISLLIIALFIYQMRRGSIFSATAFTAIFLFMCFSFTPYNMEHWNSLLGEIPAALMVVLAICLSATVTKKRELAAAGTLLGFAFLTKFISLFGIVVVGLWLLYRCWRERRWQWFFILLTATAGPILVFEIFKFSSLGLRGYVENWTDFFAFLRSQGAGQGSIVQRIAQNSGTFHLRFNVPFWVVVMSEAFVVGLSLYFPSERLRRIALLCSGAAILHLAYWVAFSAGWPRYALVGLVYHAAAISTLVLLLPLRAQIFPIVIILTQIGRPAAMYHVVRDAFQQRINPTPHLVALQHAADFIKPMLASSEVITPSWAVGIDLYYMLPNQSVHLVSNNVQGGSKQTILVQNRWFAAFVPPGAIALTKDCQDTIFQEDTYLVSRCPAKN